MGLIKSDLGKKVLSWALVFALVVTFTPLAQASHESDVINVENGVFPWDDDDLSNDLAFYAHSANEDLENITINVWKKNAIGNWEEYDDGTTDEYGELTFANVTSGEYMWDAYDSDGTKVSNEGGYVVVDSLYSVGHVGVLDDYNSDGYMDDFIAYVTDGNSTTDEAYVEIYDDNNDLAAQGYTDQEVDDDFFIFIAESLDIGNYTHYIYEEYEGDLIHNGSFYSYGNTTTVSGGDSDEWFDTWDYETEDTNGDDVANMIEVTFDPDTDCNCTMEVYIYVEIVNEDNGDYVDYDYIYEEINGTDDEDFTYEWHATSNANFTFDFTLEDDEWNYEAQFSISDIYLECDEEGEVDCESDEYFEDWEYETVDTDEDNLPDTIDIRYNPDTDCDCSVEVDVYVDVYENSTDEWVDYSYESHTVNYTESEYFEQSFESRDSQSYDFEVLMYDDNGFEDGFWIYDIYLYEQSGGGGPGDENEYFDWLDEYLYDGDNDGLNDTFEIGYDIDTTCECNVSVDLYVYIYDSDSGEWVNSTYNEYTVYHDDDSGYDWQEWSPDYNGTFDFYIELYDEDGNVEEEDDFLGIELYTRSNGGGGNGSEDEWFYSWEYETEQYDIEIGYDPDTSCDCEVEIYVYIDIYESDSGDSVDYIGDDHIIYNGEGDWFTQFWSAYNEGYFDFHVYMYDENGEFEDEFWIEYVYLGEDDGGNNGDDGVGHISVIDQWDDDDGFVNDFVGMVVEDGEPKADSYFEVYDYNENLVASGEPESWVFVASNLPEGWYRQYVYYDSEDWDLLQKGKFYSYGNSTQFETVNVDNGVMDENEDEVYDDVLFIAHTGSTEDGGVAGVEIEIYRYNESSGNWEFHADTETNESGEALLYDQPCGYYSWSSTAGIDGEYAVWAHCDVDSDYDEWFSYWNVYQDGDEGDWNSVYTSFYIESDCECDKDVDLELMVEDENGNNVNGSTTQVYIENGYGYGEFHFEVGEPGLYYITVELYDENGEVADSYEFERIISDEWFEYDWNLDGMLYVDLFFYTDSDHMEEGMMWFYIQKYDEEEDYWEYLTYNDTELIFGEDMMVEFDLCEWGDGLYSLQMNLADTYGEYEDASSIEVEVSCSDVELEIVGINTQTVTEGEQFTLYADVEYNGDVPELSYRWLMYPISEWMEGDSIQFSYPDNGQYDIKLEVSDGTITVSEMFVIEVTNADPTLELSYDDFGQEGEVISFASQTYDVSLDTVVVTWTFPDGSSIEGNFAQYLFPDDGEFMIGVKATDEDGGLTSETLVVTIENVAPTFTEFVIPSSAEAGQDLDFVFDATDPGDDTIVFTINFGDGTAPLITQDGNVSHKFAEGDTFTIVVCVKDEDGGESCREQIFPVSLLEQLEEEGALPGFNLLLALSALGIVGMLRRRTH